MEKERSLIEILKKISIFSGFTDDECAKIIPLLKYHKFNLGDTIIHEGDSGDSMYIVAEGELEIWKNDISGSRVTVGFLVSGSYFGELALIDNLPRSAAVEAINTSITYELIKTDFDLLLQADVVIANKFYSNCLKETFKRFRNILSDFTFSQSLVRKNTEVLDEINSDLESAKNLQRYFINSDYLDATPVRQNGVRQSYLYRPCFDIGGDFININTLDDNRIGVIIADVAGHGITASLATGVIKSAFSIFSESFSEKPAELISKMNKHMYDLMNNYFATCFYAFIDFNGNKIKMAKAGHPYPLLWRQRIKDFVTLDSRGVALGIQPEYAYEEYEISFEAGDKILFYTDGIIEQVNQKLEEYGDQRMTERFRALIKEDASSILPKLFDDMKLFSGRKTYDDDITLLLIEF